MADFSSIFAPDPCCYLANSGGTNITLCEGCLCGCGGNCPCGMKCCGRKKCHKRKRCGCR